VTQHRPWTYLWNAWLVAAVPVALFIAISQIVYDPASALDHGAARIPTLLAMFLGIVGGWGLGARSLAAFLGRPLGWRKCVGIALSLPPILAGAVYAHATVVFGAY
jgi:hypothetical protein